MLNEFERRPAYFAAYLQFLRDTGEHVPPGIVCTAISAAETVRFMAHVIDSRATAGEATSEADLAAIGFTPAEIARHQGAALKAAIAAFGSAAAQAADDLAAA